MSSVPATVPVFTTLNDGPQGDDIVAANENTPNAEISALATLLGMFGTGKSQAYGIDLVGFLVNQDPIITKASASALSMSAGTVWICNAAQSVRLPRQNTGAATINATNIDTGAMAIGYYYIYVCADAVANTFTVVFSTSASAPTGYTNYELYGWFYNEANGSFNVTTGYFGHYRRNKRELPNCVQVLAIDAIASAGDNAYHDMPNMSTFFVSTGRPIDIKFSATFGVVAASVYVNILIDGSEVIHQGIISAGNQTPCSIPYLAIGVAAGTHTIKVQWRASAAVQQSGVSNGGYIDGGRVLNVSEI